MDERQPERPHGQRGNARLKLSPGDQWKRMTMSYTTHGWLMSLRFPPTSRRLQITRRNAGRPRMAEADR